MRHENIDLLERLQARLFAWEERHYRLAGTLAILLVVMFFFGMTMLGDYEARAEVQRYTSGAVTEQMRAPPVTSGWESLLEGLSR